MLPPDPEPGSFVPGQPQWWQWPTILSLDAPAVAVLWQWLLSRVGRVPLAWHHFAILGFSVWLAYAADRWIEGWRLAPEQIRTQRHHFYQRHRWPVAAAWLLALAADLVLAFRHLTAAEFEAGLLLLLPVFAYLLSHQLIHRNSRWRAPKEVCVAVLLAGGAVVFPLAHPGVAYPLLVVPTGLFALLCFANCALISGWEKAVDQAHGQTSLALQFGHAHLLTRALPWTIAVLSVAYVAGRTGPARTLGVCAAASAVLLGVLDAFEARIGPRLARALADIALMTPFLVLAFERGFWRLR
jgi:hypothetical protein